MKYSFFDITYQIEFEGCPGSVLDSYMGTTTATIRMEFDVSEWSELVYPPAHPMADQSIDLAFAIRGRCTGSADSDGDTFNNDIEYYLSTDCLDDCPDVTGVDDAWPLDVNMDRVITVSFDVLPYRGRIQAKPGDPNWWQRLDLNGDGVLTVSFDVLLFRGHIQEVCT